MTEGPSQASSETHKNPYATEEERADQSPAPGPAAGTDAADGVGVEESAETKPDDEGAARRRRFSLAPVIAGLKRHATPLLIAAVVVLASLSAVLFVLFLRTSETSSEEVASFLNERQGAADDRARRVISLLMTYDATNLDEVAEQILDISTGNFKEQYQDIIQQNLGSALEEASASSRGQIVSGPDIAFLSPSEAIAIARVEQTTQSNENPAGRTFLYVLEVTLVNTEGGGWKADRVEILSAEER